MYLIGGAPIPEAVMVRKFCMSKRKNLDGWDQILLNCSGVGSWRPFKVDAPPSGNP